MSVKEGIERKRPGRKPMTPEEKAAAAADRAAKKAQADNLKPEIFMQYQGTETNMNTLVEVAKADFYSKKKRTLILDLKLYVKPEEGVAYYVVNETHEGKVSL